MKNFYAQTNKSVSDTDSGSPSKTGPRGRSLKVFLLAALLTLGFLSQAQLLIPFSGTTSLACGTNTLIKDHAGNTTYANNANGYVVIDGGFQGVVNLQGNYVTESCCDFIRIYNGIGTGGALLASYFGTGFANFTSTPGQTITVQFQSDGSVVYSGFTFSCVATGACFATPCSTAPGSNTIIPATYSTCPGLANPILNLVNSYNVFGINYQWQSSTVSPVGPFTPIPGATLTSAPLPTLGITTWYQAIITCTNTGGNFVTAASQFYVAGTTTNSVPYVEDFENIQGPNRLPNCSWYAGNIGSSVTTYTASQSNNRVPHSGSRFASFGLPSTNNIVYSNGIQMSPGITYSAALWYATEYFGYNNWSNLSILIGSAQATTGLTQIVSVGPAVSGPHKILGGTFTVPSPGIYYMVIKATAAAGSALYLSWDDLSVTIPCSGAGSVNSPTLSLSQNAYTICSGDAITLSASGADTYLWSTGATGGSTTDIPLTDKTYTVWGTNALTGCMSYSLITVKVNQSPSVLVFASSPTICVGKSVNITAVGAGSYVWSNGASTPVITVTPSLTTTYNVNGTNANGCSSAGSAVITVKNLPAISPSSSQSDACIGDLITLTGNGALTYQWLSSATGVLLQGSPISIVITANTVYTVSGTDANGCVGKATLNQNANICAGINKFSSSANGVRVYPNPTSGEFTVEFNSAYNKSLEVLDLTGRVVLSNTSADEKVNFSIKALANGIYYLKIKSNDAVEVIKVVKQ